MDYSSVSKNELDKAELARQVMNRVFSEYQNYTRGSFTGIVSNDFVEGKSKFIEGVEAGFYQGKILEINYFLDKVIKTRDKLFVSFKWEKKVLPKDSKEPNLLTGTGRFVFIEESGEWLLYQVNAGSLF